MPGYRKSSRIHDLRSIDPSPACLDPDVAVGYPQGQQLAEQLRAEGARGLIYPSGAISRRRLYRGFSAECCAGRRAWRKLENYLERNAPMDGDSRLVQCLRRMNTVIPAATVEAPRVLCLITPSPTVFPRLKPRLVGGAFFIAAETIEQRSFPGVIILNG